MQGAAIRAGLPSVMHARDAVRRCADYVPGKPPERPGSPLPHVPAANMCRQPLTCLSP